MFVVAVSVWSIRGVKSGARAGVRPDVLNKLPCHKVRVDTPLLLWARRVPSFNFMLD